MHLLRDRRTGRAEAPGYRVSSERTGALRIDLPQGPVDLGRDVVERLRDTAAAMAGWSSAARDLALLLERALEGERVLALRRGETETLRGVAQAAGLFDVVPR